MAVILKILKYETQIQFDLRYEKSVPNYATKSIFHGNDVIDDVTGWPQSRPSTWSESYFRQDLFPSYLFSRRQFHAIVIFRLKSIPALDSGSLPRFFGEFIYMKFKIVVS